MSKKLIMIATAATLGSALVVSVPAQAQRLDRVSELVLPSARSQRRVPSMGHTDIMAEARTMAMAMHRLTTAAGAAMVRRIIAGGAPVTMADIEAGAIAEAGVAAAITEAAVITEAARFMAVVDATDRS